MCQPFMHLCVTQYESAPGSISAIKRSLHSPLQADIKKTSAELEATVAAFEGDSGSFSAGYCLNALEQKISSIKTADRELKAKLRDGIMQLRQRKKEEDGKQQRITELTAASEGLQQEMQGQYSLAGAPLYGYDL